MLATLIAIFISIYIYFFGTAWGHGGLFLVSASASAVLLSFGAAALLVSFLPIQKGEQNITPRLSELFRKDLWINGIITYLFILPLLVFAASFFFQPTIPWLLLIGLGIDFLYILIRRIMDYLNPFQVVNFLKEEAFRAVDEDKDEKLCNLIESCSEVSTKSIQRHNSALANHAMDAIEEIGEDYLASTKSLSHPIQNQQLKEGGVEDSLSYVLVFICQQIESIYFHAFEKNLEIVAGQVVTTLTKLSIYAARIDVSLLSVPLFYINKISLHAVENAFQDVGVKASIGLIKIAEAINNSKGIQYQDIKSTYISIITTLDGIAKETFRKNKSIKIAILVDPFKKLMSFLEEEPMKKHQDQPIIVDQIRLVLNEFSALETVLTTMPVIPTFSEEETKY